MHCILYCPSHVMRKGIIAHEREPSQAKGYRQLQFVIRAAYRNNRLTSALMYTVGMLTTARQRGQQNNRMLLPSPQLASSCIYYDKTAPR